MRAISEEQLEVLKELSQNLAHRALSYFKMWQKPLKSRIVMPSLTKSLSRNKLSSQDLRDYAEANSGVRFYYGEQTGIELIFPASKDIELSDDEILECIFEVDTEREEMRQQRLIEKQKRRYMGEIK